MFRTLYVIDGGNKTKPVRKPRLAPRRYNLAITNANLHGHRLVLAGPKGAA